MNWTLPCLARAKSHQTSLMWMLEKMMIATTTTTTTGGGRQQQQQQQGLQRLGGLLDLEQVRAQLHYMIID